VAVQDGARVDAGWYPDPLDDARSRWWDGDRWTARSVPAAGADDRTPTDPSIPLAPRSRRERHDLERIATGEQPLTVVGELARRLADAPPPTAPRSPVRATTGPTPISATTGPIVLGTGTGPTAIRAGTGPTPLVGTGTGPVRITTFDTVLHGPNDELPELVSRHRGIRGVIGRHSPAAWVLALLPLAQLVAATLLVVLPGVSLGPWPFVAVVAAGVAVAVACAAIDRDTMPASRPRAHWAWAFGTAVVYLAVRARAAVRARRAPVAPLVVHGAALLALAGGVAAIPGIAMSAAPETASRAAEARIVADAAVDGAELQVACPHEVPVLPGGEMSCSASDVDGTVVDVVVRVDRELWWSGWEVVDWGVYSVER
jgi:hypothetical protein